MNTLKMLLITSLVSMFHVSCGKNQKLPWQKSDSNSEADPTATAPTTTTAPSTNPTNASDDAALDIPNVKNGTITNLPQLIQTIQATRWHERGSHCEGHTFAILDNGFSGLQESLGIRLPLDLKVEKAPANAAVETPHGTKLAELIWALCTGSRVYSPSRKGPSIRLYNTNGYTNFKAAVDDIVRSPVDIVLYSQVWEFGGNFDGKGFINALVNKVTDKGIRWVNAAGNFAQASWQGPLSIASNKEAKLPFAERYIRLSVSSGINPLKLTLAWNDFSEDKDYRTSQDLDLFLEDADGKQIAKADLIQDGAIRAQDPKYSLYAREQINTEVKPGIYLVRVVAKDPTKFSNQSRIRISATGSDVTFIDQTPEQSIMIPADNASVITVGADDADISSAGKVMESNSHKPEILAPSILEFDVGLSFAGSSSAAAVVAAGMAIYESTCGRMHQQTWIARFARNDFGAPSQDQKTPSFKLPQSGLCQD
ncbi:MAG: hypothetical protein NT027_03920 [Proteobacteria bacterium]|nr:hypothetical protein [Pseudomonadota bacterium]